MPTISIFIGILLILDGAFGYFFGAPNPTCGTVSLTAWIPAFFGIAFIICGSSSKKASDKSRTNIMHIAVLVSILGLIGAATHIPESLDKVNAGGSRIGLIAACIMVFLCFVFLVLSIRFFVRTRILKKE